MTTQKTASNVIVTGGNDWKLDKENTNISYRSAVIGTVGTRVSQKSENDVNVVATMNNYDRGYIEYKVTVTTNNGDSGKTTYYNSFAQITTAFNATVSAIEFTMDQMLDR